jgi:predicted flap endonuclease-1-like 5' DNA nuclease
MVKRQTLVATLLQNRTQAFGLLRELREYDHFSYNITLVDAVLVAKDPYCSVQIQPVELQQDVKSPYGGGIVGLVGGAMLFGALDTPPMSTITSTLIQLFKGLRDSGMNMSIMRNIVRDLQTNQVALLMLYEGVAHPSTIYLLREQDTRTLYASLPSSAEISLRALMTDTVRPLLNLAPMQTMATLKTNAGDAERALPKRITSRLNDDLTNIMGIDGRVEEVLKSVGLKTYSHVANASTNDLHTVLHHAGLVGSGNVATWSDQAWLASKERWEELAELQQRL